MQVTWRGKTWGAWGSSTIVLSANGLEDFKAAAANVAGGGHGVTRAPLFQGAGGWILEVTVFADSDETMAAELDAIRAVTARSPDPMDEHAFTWTVQGETARSAYARVTDRQIPSSWTTADRMNGVTLQIAYEATDPMVYGPEASAVLMPGETWSFTCDGWGYSERWEWTVPGFARYPRITWSNGTDQAIVRLGQGWVDEATNLYVHSRPRQLTTTVAHVHRYGNFDGGNTRVPAAWFRIPPGAQTIRFNSAEGAVAGAIISYRPAKP